MSSLADGGEFVEKAITAARKGNRLALGRILDFYRNYLLLTANQELDFDLQAKVAPSDVVQKTYLEACQDFGQFRGQSKSDLMGWLRGILRHNLANVRRDYRDTQKRQVSQERQPADGFEGGLSQDCPTPVTALVAAEQREILARALEQLPEHYREVIRLRHQENCTFLEIGERIGGTTEGARKRWARAIEQLKEIVKAPGQKS